MFFLVLCVKKHVITSNFYPENYKKKKSIQEKPHHDGHSTRTASKRGRGSLIFLSGTATASKPRFHLAVRQLPHPESSSHQCAIALAEGKPDVLVMVAFTVAILVEEPMARHGCHTGIVDQVRHKIYI